MREALGSGVERESTRGSTTPPLILHHRVLSPCNSASLSLALSRSRFLTHSATGTSLHTARIHAVTRSHTQSHAGESTHGFRAPLVCRPATLSRCRAFPQSHIQSATSPHTRTLVHTQTQTHAHTCEFCPRRARGGLSTGLRGRDRRLAGREQGRESGERDGAPCGARGTGQQHRMHHKVRIVGDIDAAVALVEIDRSGRT